MMRPASESRWWRRWMLDDGYQWGTWVVVLLVCAVIGRLIEGDYSAVGNWVGGILGYILALAVKRHRQRSEWDRERVKH